MRGPAPLAAARQAGPGRITTVGRSGRLQKFELGGFEVAAELLFGFELHRLKDGFDSRRFAGYGSNGDRRDAP